MARLIKVICLFEHDLNSFESKRAELEEYWSAPCLEELNVQLHGYSSESSRKGIFSLLCKYIT